MNNMDIRLVLPILQCFFASIIVISTVVVSAQKQGECCQEYCYDLDNERPQSAHFGTKTAYVIAKGPESGRQYKVPSTYSYSVEPLCLTFTIDSTVIIN